MPQIDQQLFRRRESLRPDFFPALMVARAPRNSRLPSSEKLSVALSLTTKSLRKPGDEVETISVALVMAALAWLRICAPQ